MKPIYTPIDTTSPISEEDWEALTSAMIPRNSSPKNTELIRRVMGGARLDRFPAHKVVLVDHASGRVWVQDYANTGWTILDSAGFLIGRFDLSGRGSRTSLVGVDSDNIILSEEDGSGELVARVYKLREPMSFSMR